MKHVLCPVCKSVCIRYGKTSAGSQRWYCKSCRAAFSPDIDHSTKQLNLFLKWLFGRETQKEMPGGGRSFRRKTAKFWEIWPMPAVIEEKKEVVYCDGIYLGRKACVLICCDDEHVLGWYLCRYEHSGAWKALMTRIAEPYMVVSDGGTGFVKALRKAWPNAKHQRCIFHVFSQIRRYTTSNPKTAAGMELYTLAKDMLHIKSRKEEEVWAERFLQWMKRYQAFLSQMTYDENGNSRPTHERLLKAQRSLYKLLREGTIFTYLSEEVKKEIGEAPATNNRIEGGVNARLREMLRDHRGLSIERRIKAVFWWCYMHSEEPLSASEIIKVMPTDKAISDIYKRMNQRQRKEFPIKQWGDAIVWSELHRSSDYPVYWD